MNTKLIVALAIVGVLAATVIGLAAAQAATSTPVPNVTNGNGGPINGFIGWMGRCFRYGEPYLGTQTPTSGSQPLNITVTDPNTNTTTTYQGYPGYGMPYYPNQPQNITVTNPNTSTSTTYQGFYGRGCMGRFFP